MTYTRKVFERRASRWRQALLDDCDVEVEGRKEVASLWQRYSDTAEHLHNSATLTEVTNPSRKLKLGNLWWSKGGPPMQATLALRRGCTTVVEMQTRIAQHPLAVGRDGTTNTMMFGGQGEGAVHG